jgi:hypothetical protein
MNTLNSGAGRPFCKILVCESFYYEFPCTRPALFVIHYYSNSRTGEHNRANGLVAQIGPYKVVGYAHRNRFKARSEAIAKSSTLTLEIATDSCAAELHLTVRGETIRQEHSASSFEPATI